MTEVYLTDQKLDYYLAQEKFQQAGEWAKEFCASFLGYRVQDVSDVSYLYDQVALYRFDEERDAVFFRLKWDD